MTGAMYSAVAGLKTHMSALNVIGNNIANVNTYGYKASRYTFDEALYTTSRSGSNGTLTMGGRNPAQIGYGCSIGTIDTDMSTKTFNPTSFGLDTMIDGDGFFLLGDKSGVGITSTDQLQGMTLSRLGNIDFKDGYLVDGDGNVVYGFPVVAGDDEGGNNSELGDHAFSYSRGTVLAPLRFPKVKTTTETDPNTGVTVTSSEVLYPTEENYTPPTGAGGGATGGTDGPKVLKYDETGEGDNNATGDAPELPMPVLDSISIDEHSGRISGITEDGIVMVIGYLAIGKVDNPNGVTHVDGRYYKALDGAGKLHVTVLDEGLVRTAPQAGGGTGGAGGTTGTDGYTGPFDIESAGDTGIVTGGLEQSGTDLATEISNMILMQRGYQANTRIVTVTDSMLEELVNMKRG